MSALRRLAAGLRRGESGQAMTETAIIYGALLAVPGYYVLTKFAPDAMAAASVYLNSIYLVLGLPIG